MALGLTDHIWSYREYIWLPVHKDPAFTRQMEERIARLLSPALHDQPKRCIPEKATAIEGREEEVDPRPKAA